MPNMTITNVDVGSVIFQTGEFEDGVLTTAGALTVKEGTILARDSVSLKFVPYVVGGSTNGNGVPKAVMTYATAATGAGDIPVRPMISGKVRQERLVVQAAGDGSTITAAVLDLLRDCDIVPVPVSDLSVLDNQ